MTPKAVLLLVSSIFSGALMAQSGLSVQNAAGVVMVADASDTDPVLLVTVPDGPVKERTFKVLVPEHLTVLLHGQTDVQHLYVYAHKPGTLDAHWKQSAKALQYETTLGAIHFLARATLVEDGILFHYEFTNSGDADYDMITAVTDPRFRAVFYDPRLERTYVHRGSGFQLLASNTPERLTMPLKEWFPVRFLASYTAPIPAQLVQKRADGITYRYDPVRVDAPMIATLSEDRKWVAASFSRDPGNVWTNPQLTCQHVDPQVPLPHAGHAVYEVKVLIFQGSLQEAWNRMHKQLAALQ